MLHERDLREQDRLPDEVESDADTEGGGKAVSGNAASGREASGKVNSETDRQQLGSKRGSIPKEATSQSPSDNVEQTQMALRMKRAISEDPEQ